MCRHSWVTARPIPTPHSICRGCPVWSRVSEVQSRVSVAPWGGRCSRHSMVSDRGLCICGCGTRTRKRRPDASGHMVYDSHVDTKFAWNGAGAARASITVKVRKMSRHKFQQRVQNASTQKVKQLQRDLALALKQVQILREQMLDDRAKHRLLQNIRDESRELRMDLSYLEDLRLAFPEHASQRLPLARLRLCSVQSSI